MILCHQPLALGSWVESTLHFENRLFINTLKTSILQLFHPHHTRTHKMKLSTPLFFATAASAHTIFVSVNGGKVGDGVRVPSYDGPINDVSSNDIVCNGGPNPTASTSTVITLQAGSTATLTWRHTLTSGDNDIIDASHKGPVMAYLKKVSDAKTDSGIGGGWFKACHYSSLMIEQC
jgi:hypothetical protein